jgi:hypothetical protein
MENNLIFNSLNSLLLKFDWFIEYLPTFNQPFCSYFKFCSSIVAFEIDRLIISDRFDNSDKIYLIFK